VPVGAVDGVSVGEAVGLLVGADVGDRVGPRVGTRAAGLLAVMVRVSLLRRADVTTQVQTVPKPASCNASMYVSQNAASGNRGRGTVIVEKTVTVGPDSWICGDEIDPGVAFIGINFASILATETASRMSAAIY